LNNLIICDKCLKIFGKEREITEIVAYSEGKKLLKLDLCSPCFNKFKTLINQWLEELE